MESINDHNEHLSNALPPATGTTALNVGRKERIISIVGGAALLWLGTSSPKSRAARALLVSTGTALIGRGLVGYCPVNAAVGRNTAHRVASAMEVKGVYTINGRRKMIYDYWRNLANLPNFMEHIDSVTVTDDHRSHWEARFPGIGMVKWDAYITEDQPGEYISWSTLPGSRIDQAGEVSFTDAPNGRGTIMNARIAYRLPAGIAGHWIGKMMNPAVERIVRSDLRSFKSLMETGDLPANKPRPKSKKQVTPIDPANMISPSVRREDEYEDSLAGRR